ncbi:MAG: FHA domain-containing protein [Actinomycetota bacterium]
MLGAGVEPVALSALKYGLLALLFLFLWRSMRWVVRGLSIDAALPAVSGAAVSAAATGDPVPTTLLVHPTDGGKPKGVRLETATTIGRGAECELRIEDTFASQQHARIFGKSGGWYVEDLGSTNGTYVNEQRLAAPALLQPGDRVRVGTTILELRR